MHFPATRLVQHIYFGSVPERCFTVNQNNIHVLYETIVADDVIGNIILYAFDDHVVADPAVVNNRVVNAGMFGQSTGKPKLFLQDSDFYFTGKTGVSDVIGREIIFHPDKAPVFAGTSVFGQASYFGFCKVSQIVHCMNSYRIKQWLKIKRRNSLS